MGITRILVVVCIALAIGINTSSGQGTFRRVDIDSTGQLRIEFSNARVSVLAKDSDQVGVEQVALSSDRRVVGWVGLYPNCCTSYPLPLKLMLLRAGGRRTTITNDLPIWAWAFAGDGRSVVIRQAPVHGAVATYYQRRDIRTGRVIATAVTDSTTTALPAWARAAMPRRTSLPPLSNER